MHNLGWKICSFCDAVKGTDNFVRHEVGCQNWSPAQGIFPHMGYPHVDGTQHYPATPTPARSSSSQRYCVGCDRWEYQCVCTQRAKEKADEKKDEAKKEVPTNGLLVIDTRKEKVPMDGLIIRASKIATEAHRGQWRLYTKDTQVWHPMRVAGRITMLYGATPVEIAAAWLHDTLEDTTMTRKSLEDRGMPNEVIVLVEELTNASAGDKTSPRPERKARDLEKLARVSKAAQRIKLVDRLDNLAELSFEDLDFMEMYINESKTLVGAIGHADIQLADEMRKLIAWYEDEVKKDKETQSHVG